MARRLAWVLLLVLPTSLRAQDSLVSPWEFTATLNAYWYPDEDVSWLPVFTADRDRLHFETRYNYEDERTASLFAGWLLPWDGALSVECTPMLGLVVGNTNGLAPALELDVVWWRLELYSEMEYLISLDGAEYDFFYAWTETTVQPVNWFGAGLVGQRTLVVESEREIDRGFLLRGSLDRFEGTFYLFNPDDEFPYYVFSLEVSF